MWAHTFFLPPNIPFILLAAFTRRFFALVAIFTTNFLVRAISDCGTSLICDNGSGVGTSGVAGLWGVVLILKSWNGKLNTLNRWKASDLARTHHWRINQCPQYYYQWNIQQFKSHHFKKMSKCFLAELTWTNSSRWEIEHMRLCHKLLWILKQKLASCEMTQVTLERNPNVHRHWNFEARTFQNGCGQLWSRQMFDRIYSKYPKERSPLILHCHEYIIVRLILCQQQQKSDLFKLFWTINGRQNTHQKKLVAIVEQINSNFCVSTNDWPMKPFQPNDSLFTVITSRGFYLRAPSWESVDWQNKQNEKWTMLVYRRCSVSNRPAEHQMEYKRHSQNHHSRK